MGPAPATDYWYEAARSRSVFSVMDSALSREALRSNLCASFGLYSAASAIAGAEADSMVFLHFEAYALGQHRFPSAVYGIRRAAHIRLPRI